MAQGAWVEGFSEEAIQRDLDVKRIGRFVKVFEEVGSTNDEAGALAEAGAPEGMAVIAERQLRGRGRLGRRWESPGGVGIWTSILLRPPLPPEEAPLLGLLAAVATAEAVGETIGLPCRIKWPNDILVSGGKVGGILAELQAEGGRIRHLILGIGLNVNQTPEDFPEALRPFATSLRIESGKEVSRLALLRALYLKLDHWYDRLLQEGSASVLTRYRVLCLTLGEEVEVHRDRETLTGKAVDLGPLGELLIELPSGGLQKVFSGEATLRRGVSPSTER